ncbi:hypothetical protein D3C74_397210 [compost metagenome]
MTRLLAAQVISTTTHLFHHIAVTNSRFGCFQRKLLCCFVETNITHNGRHHRAIFQLACPIHRVSANTQNKVAIHFGTRFINSNQAIGIPVKSKTKIRLMFQHLLF